MASSGLIGRLMGNGGIRGLMKIGSTMRGIIMVEFSFVPVIIVLVRTNTMQFPQALQFVLSQLSRCLTNHWQSSLIPSSWDRTMIHPISQFARRFPPSDDSRIVSHLSDTMIPEQTLGCHRIRHCMPAFVALYQPSLMGLKFSTQPIICQTRTPPSTVWG